VQQVIKGGCENEERCGENSDARAASNDALVAGHGELFSVVGLEGGVVAEVHIVRVGALEFLPLGQTGHGLRVVRSRITADYKIIVNL